MCVLFKICYCSNIFRCILVNKESYNAWQITEVGLTYFINKVIINGNYISINSENTTSIRVIRFDRCGYFLLTFIFINKLITQ